MLLLNLFDFSFFAAAGDSLFGLSDINFGQMNDALVFLIGFLFAAIDGFFPPIPSESFIIALASLSVSAGSPALWVVVACAALGAFSGDQIAYFIGSRVKTRDLLIFRRPQARAVLDWAESALKNQGSSFIIAARYIPVGRVAVNMTAGALRYPRRRFMALTAFAAISWSVFSTIIGIGAGRIFEGHPVMAITIGVIGGIVIGLVIDLFIKRWNRKKASFVSNDD